MKFLYMVLFLALVFFFLTFAFQNPVDIHLRYFGYIDQEFPLYLLLFGSFFAGAVLASLVGAVDRIKLTLQINKLYKRIDELEKKNLTLLKSMPPTADARVSPTNL